MLSQMTENQGLQFSNIEISMININLIDLSSYFFTSFNRTDLFPTLIRNLVHIELNNMGKR